MTNSILKSLGLLFLALTISVSSASAENSKSPAPPDTSGDHMVLQDGGIILPTDTMRAWIEYYELVYMCLKQCNQCLDSVLCGYPCNEICDTLTQQEINDSLDSGIISPTDTEYVQSYFNGLAEILQSLYTIEKSAELKLHHMNKFSNTKNLSKIYFQNLENRKKYRSLLIRLNFLIKNFELLYFKTAIKISNQ